MISKFVSYFLITLFAVLLVLPVANAQSTSVGVIKGDSFTWSVETIGDYQLFTIPFGRDYDKIEQIRLDVIEVANPILKYTLTITYDNGTQILENFSQNLETGIMDNSLRQFLYPAGMRPSETLHTEDEDFQIEKTETLSYLGVERQFNYYSALNLSDNVLMYNVAGNVAYLYLSFESYFDKYTGVLAESSEFWEGVGAIGPKHNFTLVFKLVESTAFNSGLGSAHFQSFSALAGDVEYAVNASSNSDLSDFSYSDSAKEIRFTASGQSGTMGYTYLYIPKGLITDYSKLKVYLDGKQIEYVAEKENNIDVLFFRYQHSAHIITISLAEGSTFGGWLLYVAVAGFVAVLIVVGLIAVLKRKRKTAASKQIAPSLGTAPSGLVVLTESENKFTGN